MRADRDHSFFLMHLAAFILVPALVFWLSYERIGQWVLANPQREADYLEGIRNNSTLSCLSVLARQPEVLVVGNSGNYAGWDMRLLQQLSGKRVGGCMMGGATVETVGQVLDLVAAAENPPRRIIYGTNVYAFQKFATSDAQAREHASLLNEAKRPYLFWLRFLLDEVLQRRHYAASAAERDRSIAAHSAPLMQLDVRAIDKVVEVMEPVFRERSANMAAATRLPDPHAAAAQLCGKARALGAELSVVNVPVSPAAAARISPELAAYYGKALDGFQPCAQAVVKDDAAEYGLDNRHYVNRYLKPMDYELASAEAVSRTPFDPDHLNPIGAQLFTRRAACLLFDSTGCR